MYENKAKLRKLWCTMISMNLKCVLRLFCLLVTFRDSATNIVGLLQNVNCILCLGHHPVDLNGFECKQFTGDGQGPFKVL